MKRLAALALGLSILVTPLLSFGSAAVAACTATGEGTPATATKIWTTAIATIYNVFPIRIGGVTIMTFQGLEDFSAVSDVPVCLCMDPFPRLGIKVSLWEPVAFMEVTSIPGCFPSIGVGVPVPTPRGQTGFGRSDTDLGGKHSYNFHYIKFHPFFLLNLFLDFVCLEGEPLDIGYTTELDPLWNNDLWAGILNPEAILVANPIAQLACIADAGASAVGFPLDFLWWCLGSWGSLYPMTGNSNQADEPSGAFAIAARGIAKLHRQLMLWGSIGEAGLCGRYPMPIMRKSQYSLLPVHPVPFPFRVPIGRTSILWAEGQEAPFVNKHNWVMMVYRKRDCCAF